MKNFKINIKKFGIFIICAIINYVLLFSVRRYILNFCGAKINNGVTFHRGVLFYCFSGLSVGKNCTINYGCIIDPRGGLFIGDNVSISHCVKIYTAGHDIKKPGADFFTKRVFIGDNVWIFLNALIMPGVKIGAGAVIYPGAVVVRDVEDFSIVAGNPAKVVGIRPNNMTYNASFPVWFGI